jgi:hypothetical protein
MDDFEMWEKRDIAKMLLALANSTGEQYAKARKDFDARSIQFCFGLLQQVTDLETQVAVMQGLQSHE